MAKAFLGLKSTREDVPRGRRFGAREVLNETTPDPKGRRRFTVRCECGGIDRMPLTDLKRLTTKKTGGRCKRCAKRWLAAQQKDDGHGSEETSQPDALGDVGRAVHTALGG